MNRKIPGLSGLCTAALAVAFSVGCQGSGSFASLQETLAQITDKQDTILARLDTLEGKIGAGAAAPGRPAAQPPQAGKPDPSATYKVAVADAHTKGPADAKVTIVEWSDFQ
jgi:hypothetical protein